MSPSIAPASHAPARRTDRGDAARITPILSALAILGGSVGIGLWLGRRFSRHIVSGESMEPTLREHDWIFVDRAAYARTLPRPGDIVLARDPREPTRELVKRVNHIDVHGGSWLLGDNPPRSTDSRIFGAVPAAAITGRVRFRYWPAPRGL